MKILFWGRATGCPATTTNGPVTARIPEVFRNAETVTTIPLDEAKKDFRWSPAGNLPSCDSAVHNFAGPAFVHINETSKQGGIGLFTHAGKSDAPTSLWGSYDAAGSVGSGASKHIQGTFVVFRFDWQNGNTVSPWRGGNQTATIWSRQGVGAYRTGNVKHRTSKADLIQVKQQMAFNFINSECMRVRDPGGTASCQVKYLFNTAVMRGGISNWENERWFQVGDVMFDPGQRGLAVVHGPIKTAGEQTISRGRNGVDLWTSRGEPTQHDTFTSKDFVVQISFRQLMNAIKLVAARRNNHEAAYFGPKWDDPNSWLLLSVTIGQEARNANPEMEAYIGGATNGIYVGSVFPSAFR
jgi:hypothetical protein